MRVFRKNTVIALTAILMVLLVSVGLTMAYFSDYETTYGTAAVYLTGETEIEEEVTDTQKVVSLKNTGKSSIVVRAAIFGPDIEPYKMTVTMGEGWSKNEETGFYYYNRILEPGDSTAEIVAKYDNLPVDIDLRDFEITVVNEAAVAVYDGDTVAKPEGWDGFPVIR